MVSFDLPINAEPGRLPDNIMHFCRVLRAAGLPVGPGRTLAALEAVATVGVGSRQDFYWALHSALITRRDQRALFDQAFHLFWRNPDLLKRAMQLFLPQVDAGDGRRGEEVLRRLAEAMAKDRQAGEGDAPEDSEEPPEIELDLSLTFSSREVERQRDFEQMTADELRAARAAIARMRLPAREMRTRRFRPTSTGGSVDLRRTLRRSLRGGGAIIDLARRKRRTRPPPLVILCDISGSMSQYARMLLHFVHTLTSDRDRVHSFVFGTRLTNITRSLRLRDVDAALEKIGRDVTDWDGGTRIGSCLTDFNLRWGRRVLTQGAVVLLITDGLDRDAGEGLSREMDRLHRSSRRLIWLNPLLRWDGYLPKSSGARAMMPFVDEFRPVHNLASLDALVAALSQDHADDGGMDRWRYLAMEVPAA